MKHLGENLVDFRVNCPSKELLADIEALCNTINDESDDNLFGTDFEADFGGCFYLVETYEDLNEVTTAVGDFDNNKYKSILETAAAFDVCEYIGTDYVQILLCTNNAGGRTFLVPAFIAKQCPNIEKSIELTKRDKL